MVRPEGTDRVAPIRGEGSARWGLRRGDPRVRVAVDERGRRRLAARGWSLVALCGLLSACQARSGAASSATPSAAETAADGPAGAIVGARPRECPITLSAERVRPVPERYDAGDVAVRLPEGIRALDLIGPPPRIPLHPEFEAAMTMRSRTYPSVCGTIASMAVGAIDDVPSREMPEFVLTVLRERLDFEAGAMEQVVALRRSLRAVVRGAAADDVMLWVDFRGPDDDCKSYFVVLAAGPEDFAALLPMFKAVTASMRIIGGGSTCNLRGGGGGYG